LEQNGETLVVALVENYAKPENLRLPPHSTLQSRVVEIVSQIMQQHITAAISMPMFGKHD
jgi:hypothetical protein